MSCIKRFCFVDGIVRHRASLHASTFRCLADRRDSFPSSLCESRSLLSVHWMRKLHFAHHKSSNHFGLSFGAIPFAWYGRNIVVIKLCIASVCSTNAFYGKFDEYFNKKHNFHYACVDFFLFIITRSTRKLLQENANTINSATTPISSDARKIISWGKPQIVASCVYVQLTVHQRCWYFVWWFFVAIKSSLVFHLLFSVPVYGGSYRTLSFGLERSTSLSSRIVLIRLLREDKQSKRT